jgi:O-antigen/teichoic acid export membrane protein
MSFQRSLARNVIWNWAGMVALMLAGFLVAPFLVHRLGETVYGLWILIASLTSYFGLFDLGVRGSVGRYIAFHRARDDRVRVNATLSTALTILCGTALAVLAGTFALSWLFFRIFDVPAAEVDETRLALLVVGVNLALTFPLNVFDATLWAFQRFDLLNAIDIPAVILRTALTFYFIGTGHGLVTLALVTLLTTVAGSLVKAWLTVQRGFR